jgi:hypothetical protein
MVSQPLVLCIGVLIVAGKDDELLSFGEERAERASSSKGESALLLESLFGLRDKAKKDLGLVSLSP